jgi:hypothetical protein
MTTVPIDDGAPVGARFAGGVCQTPNGSWLAAWMRDDGVRPTVLVREATDLLNPSTHGPIMELTASTVGYDPSVNQLKDDSVIATMESGDAVLAAKRLAPGLWTAPIKIYGTGRPDLHVKEQCAQRIGSRIMVTINEMGPTQFDHPASVRHFELLGQSAGPVQTITDDGTGIGTEGKQCRVAEVRGKKQNQVIVAFSRDADGGPRPIAVCRSIDAGATWKDLGDLLRWTRNSQDYDLVNPIAVRMGPTDVRLYFVVDHYGLGMASTADGGLTWSPITIVPLDPALTAGHLFVFKDERGRLLALASAKDFHALYVTQLPL